MATQQNDDSGQSSLAISPSLIVGIVILASFACIILFASIFRYCRRNQSNLIDPEGLDEIGGTELYNPNKQRSASQVARLKEVRWINNMYAWERGRQARLAVGEIRPTTMLMGRRGENKNWDEYTIMGDNSWQIGPGNGNAGGEDSHASYFYNLDDPYARSCSQQRLSHLVPPPDQSRNSYQSTASGNGLLPRHPSALLPPPAHGRRDAWGMVAQNSPLRNEYQVDNQEQDPGAVFEARPQYRRNRAGDDSTYPTEYHSPFVNPTITVSDESQSAAYIRSPTTLAYDSNFETVTLGGHSRIATESRDVDANQRSRSRQSAEDLGAHRPSVVVTNDQAYPQLQLQFLSQSLSQNSVSVYDDEEAVHPDGLEDQSSLRPVEREAQQNNRQLEEVDASAKGDTEISRRNVTGMIQEWEKANGSFGRSHLAAT
ncbi:hypothetical protein CLAIMM_05072 [Cladophialophora immunda]|nr:hypothetical protein CLAIMM_05072 [Cladophialophora immunda]